MQKFIEGAFHSQGESVIDVIFIDFPLVEKVWVGADLLYD
jgi:hypothetical protein